MTALSHSRPRDCKLVARQDPTGSMLSGRVPGNDREPGDLPLKPEMQRPGYAVKRALIALSATRIPAQKRT